MPLVTLAAVPSAPLSWSPLTRPGAPLAMDMAELFPPPVGSLKVTVNVKSGLALP